MPILRRLTLAILSILLLILITSGLAQPVYAQTTTTTVQAMVIWFKGPKPSIQLQLFRTSTTTPIEAVPGDTLKVLLAGGTSANWVDVATHDASNNPYTFSVKQGTWNAEKTIFSEATPPYYTATTSPDGLTITNTYTIPTKGQFTAEKYWVNGSSPRPDVALQLYRKTTAMPAAEPVPDGLRPLLGGVTKISWNTLEQTDINGLLYEFTVRELHYDATQAKFVDGPPANYSNEVLYTENHLRAVVTNTYTSNLIDVTAAKKWKGGADPRPPIAFRLYRTTGTTARQPLANAFIKDLAPGTVTVTWTGLEANDTNGNPYVYTVVEGTWDAGPIVFTEGPPPNYQAIYSADGLTVTNTFVEPKVTAHKVWENGPTLRPTIWFKLYRQVGDGIVQPVPTTEAPLKELTNGTTEVVWTNITFRDPANQPYIFTVREVDAQGQPFVPNNYAKTESGLTVTNTYVIPKNATAKATKVWTYGPAIKPTIGFRLYRTITGGSPLIALDVAIIELPNGTSEANWTGLEATDLAGNTYTFSVKEGTWNAGRTLFTEGAPTNYQPAFSPDGLTVNNTYVSPKINITGTKIWIGGPAAKQNIQIQLYRNGALMGSRYTLTSGITSYTWSSVDQTDLNGATYLYTVDEVTVPAFYSKRVNGMTITNTYTGTLPYTGDNTHNARWLVLLLGLSALLPLMSWLDLKLLTRRRG